MTCECVICGAAYVPWKERRSQLVCSRACSVDLRPARAVDRAAARAEAALLLGLDRTASDIARGAGVSHTTAINAIRGAKLPFKIARGRRGAVAA